MICHTTDKRFVTRLIPFLVLSACLANHLSAQALVMVSGNGQMVFDSSHLSQLPLVVQANDAGGNPVPGVAITWAITTGAGTLPDAAHVTNASGQASTHFTTTTLQGQASYLESTVTASSKFGNVSFFLITVPYLTGSGAQATPPSVTLRKPQDFATLTGLPGSTLPDAVEVQVQAGTGAQTNAGIPNVSIHMVDGNNPTVAPSAHCNGPGGLVYTDSNGTAKCDLVITGKPSPNVYALRANAGVFSSTPPFDLQINPGPVCTYSIAPISQAIGSAGSNGTVTVTTATACGWATNSNVPWITITAGASGTGNGTVSYSVGADAAGPRSGTLTIAGKTFTVNQGSGGGVLTITTPADLPGGTVNQSYSTTLSASGGNPPYTWSVTSGALPAGLTLNSSTGLISGAATAAGTGSFTISAQDNNAATTSMVFSLTINASSSTFVITNTSFPNGIVDQIYKTQTLTSSGGVITPFFLSPGFKVSGGALPPGLAIVKNPDDSSAIAGTPTTAGAFAFTLTASDAAQNTTSANFTITITGTPVAEMMGASPASIPFTVQLGSLTAPAPEALSITGNSGVLTYTSIATTASGGSWLALQNSAGNTPGTINVSVTNYSNLEPGPYSGAVTVSSAASNSPIVVPVTMTVLAAPALSVSPSQINVSQGQTTASNVTTQNIEVTAGTGQTSGAATGFSAAAATNKGGNWLSVSPSAATTPATVTVSIDSAGLAIGTYAGTVTVTPTAGAVQLVTVTLNVINPQMLSAAPAPVAFTYPKGPRLRRHKP